MKRFIFTLIAFYLSGSSSSSFYSMNAFPEPSHHTNNSWQLGETVSLSVKATVNKNQMRGTIDFPTEPQRAVRLVTPKPTYTGPTAVQLKSDKAELRFKNQTVPVRLLNEKQLHDQQNLFTEAIIAAPKDQEEEYAARTEARMRAFETNQQPYQQTFQLSHQSKELITAAQCKPEQFTILIGSPVQHLLHQELLDAIDHTAISYQMYHASNPIQEHCIQVARFADLGVRANWSGNLILGFEISDWCWQAAQRIGQIGQAIITGIAEVVADSPNLLAVATIGRVIGQNATGRIMLALAIIPQTWKLLKIAQKGIDLYFRSTTQDPQAEEDFQDFLRPVKKTISEAKNLGRYASFQTVLNIFKGASAFTTQIYIQRKIASDIKHLYQQTYTALKQAIKKGISYQELRACALPGGPNVQLARPNDHLFFKKCDKTTKPTLATTAATAITKPFDIRSFGGKQGFYIFKGKRVNVFYESITEKWWAKDLTRHGGSYYKVFKQKGNYLLWQFDADEHGNKIISKHKGPKGLKVKFFGA